MNTFAPGGRHSTSPTYQTEGTKRKLVWLQYSEYPQRVGFERIDRAGPSELHCGLLESAAVPATLPGSHDWGDQKLRKRKSLALASTFARMARSGSRRAISMAPIIVEKIAKKARSFSAVRRPGMNGNIWLL